MPQLFRVAVIDQDSTRAQNLILYLKHLQVLQIEYFREQSDFFKRITNIENQISTNVVFLYTDHKNSVSRIKFVDEIMKNQSLSHIQIYLVSENHNEPYIIDLFRHGAIGHLHLPLSVEKVMRIIAKASQITYKIG